ncbi:hypothetical protein ABW19_dt0207876 [Dactylella cylindrospora]|nr:hypothetical protein ABW19_dt0207876 [Dactylella cylindrospora]
MRRSHPGTRALSLLLCFPYLISSLEIAFRHANEGDFTPWIFQPAFTQGRNCYPVTNSALNPITGIGLRMTPKDKRDPPKQFKSKIPDAIGFFNAKPGGSCSEKNLRFVLFFYYPYQADQRYPNLDPDQIYRTIDQVFQLSEIPENARTFNHYREFRENTPEWLAIMGNIQKASLVGELREGDVAYRTGSGLWQFEQNVVDVFNTSPALPVPLLYDWYNEFGMRKNRLERSKYMILHQGAWSSDLISSPAFDPEREEMLRAIKQARKNRKHGYWTSMPNSLELAMTSPERVARQSLGVGKGLSKISEETGIQRSKTSPLLASKIASDFDEPVYEEDVTEAELEERPTSQVPGMKARTNIMPTFPYTNRLPSGDTALSSFTFNWNGEPQGTEEKLSVVHKFGLPRSVSSIPNSRWDVGQGKGKGTATLNQPDQEIHNLPQYDSKQRMENSAYQSILNEDSRRSAEESKTSDYSSFQGRSNPQISNLDDDGVRNGIQLPQNGRTLRNEFGDNLDTGRFSYEEEEFDNYNWDRVAVPVAPTKSKNWVEENWAKLNRRGRKMPIEKMR